MKKILLLILIIICCGCTAKYEIKFFDDTITDNLTVTYERNGESDSEINDTYSNSFYSIGRSNFYNFKNLSNNNNIIVDLSYDYGIDVYNSANIPNSCFETFRFLSDDSKYYFFAQGAFKCGYYAYEYLDSLDIVITTNHIVEDHNADEVNDNKYIWHVDPNSEDLDIKFIANKEVVNGKKFNSTKILMISISVFVGLFILIISLFIRNKLVNRI